MRQQSERGLEEVQSRSMLMIAIIGGIMLAPGIACLVIATEYNGGGSCTGSYTVDLVTFLEVAGGLQVAFGGLAILCGICSAMKDLPHSAAQGNGCVGLFYLIWAAIGLYMWDNQMSADCQSDAIAQMVLAWSVIQYAMLSERASIPYSCIYPIVDLTLNAV